jgi:hypothetical protein
VADGQIDTTVGLPSDQETSACRSPSIVCARHGADFQLHQPLGGEADHLSQQIGVRGLRDQVARVHHVSSHRWSSRSGIA